MFDFGTKYNYVVNLDRRKDRLDKLIKLLKDNEINLSNFIRLSAVDGQITDFSYFDWLFGKTDLTNIKNPYPSHNFKKGVLGCALSHFKIWELIANVNCDNDEMFLVLEDDIKFSDDFKNKYNNVRDILINDKRWDIIFLGYTDDADIKGDYLVHDNIKCFSGEPRKRGGGMFGFLIRKKCAAKLIDLAKENGIRQPVDWFLIEQYDKLCCYRCINDIIISTPTFRGNKDSDIQFE